MTVRQGFEILGPLTVRLRGTAVRLGGPRQRSVLALLLLNAGEVLPVGRIIDELWEGNPPRAAETTLRGYVSQLRKALAEPTPLVTATAGYQLDVEPDQVDATRFERLLARGLDQLRAHDHANASDTLRNALSLWHGPALADLAGLPWARDHCTRLEGLRETAIASRVEADLGLGRHAELVSELGALADRYPLRERLHASRMLALYRSGRQAEALQAYREAHDALASAHGIDPGAPMRELHAAILRQDPALDWRPTPAPVATPAELPADVPNFTGRTAPLAALDALLGGAHQTVVISAIAGAGGVGKTALAVRWGHRVRERFPDGQLHVDLRGHSPGSPMKPIEALGRFLRSLGLPAERVPVDADEAAARYRSLLANRKVLVLLDNAADAQQVRPLLPASAGCLVVVTSRDRLTGLVAHDGAVMLALDVLPEHEALTLLIRMLGEDRVGAELDAARELTRLCGNLPLAIRIAAAKLMCSSSNIRDYVADLRDGDRLDALTAGDDDRSAVRAAFDLSYTALSGPARRLFRLLGLVPGADFTADVAAAVADLPVAETRVLLDRLVGAHVIQQHASRYSLHDLLRLYAAEHVADDPDQDAALTRLFDHCLTATAQATDAAFPSERRDAEAPKLTAIEGREWLDAERSNLSAVVALAAARRPPVAGELATLLWTYHVNAPHFGDALTVHTHALQSAGDPVAEAEALTKLGAASWKTGNPTTAQHHLERALALRREAGDHSGEAWSLSHLASVHWSCGRFGRFFDLAGKALAAFRALGDHNGELVALINLGEVHGRVGRYELGVEQLTEAARLAREVGHATAESGAVEALSLVHWWSGQHQEAFDHARTAVALARRTSNQADESSARTVLALVHAQRGEITRALRQADHALTLARETRIPRRETVALNSLAEVLRAAGRPAESLARHHDALTAAQATGDRDEQARALDGAAHALHATGNPAQAREYWRQALRIYTDLAVPDARRVTAHLL